MDPDSRYTRISENLLISRWIHHFETFLLVFFPFEVLIDAGGNAFVSFDCGVDDH